MLLMAAAFGKYTLKYGKQCKCRSQNFLQQNFFSNAGETGQHLVALYFMLALLSIAQIGR